MMPLVIGPPDSGALATARDVMRATGGAATLAWLSGPSLSAVVDDMLAAGGTVLAADLPGAFAHQLAVHGAPAVVVVSCDDAQDDAGIERLVARAVAELPPCAVLVVGPTGLADLVTAILRGRELADPLPVDPADLAEIVRELARSATWERV